MKEGEHGVGAKSSRARARTGPQAASGRCPAPLVALHRVIVVRNPTLRGPTMFITVYSGHVGLVTSH